jgi:hypothetical protein
VAYLRSLEAQDRYHRLVVIIPEVEPAKPWQWLLHNQRGIILERAVRRGTSNVVLCRLRYRLATLTEAPDGEHATPASDHATPGGEDEAPDGGDGPRAADAR